MKQLIHLLILTVLVAMLSACAALAATPEDSGQIEINLKDYDIQPRVIRVKAGQQVTFVLKNEGDKLHELMIGRDVNIEGDFSEGFAEDFFAGITPEIEGPGMVMGLEGGDMAGMDMGSDKMAGMDESAGEQMVDENMAGMDMGGDEMADMDESAGEQMVDENMAGMDMGEDEMAGMTEDETSSGMSEMDTMGEDMTGMGESTDETMAEDMAGMDMGGDEMAEDEAASAMSDMDTMGEDMAGMDESTDEQMADEDMAGMDMKDDEMAESTMDDMDEHAMTEGEMDDEGMEMESDMAGMDEHAMAEDEHTEEDDHADDEMAGMGHDETEDGGHNDMIGTSFGALQRPSMDAHAGLMVMLDPAPMPEETVTTITFTVPEDKVGTWTMGCFQEQGQHYDDGMRGTLIVEPAS